MQLSGFPSPVGRPQRWIGLTLAILASSAMARHAVAQVERYELGQRLRRFEVAWQEAGAERRAAAVEPMNRAVRSFFGLQLRSAAAALDEAWFAVRKEGPADEMERAVIARHLAIAPLVSEPGGKPVIVRWEEFYGGGRSKTEPEAPADNAGSSINKESRESASASGPKEEELRLVLELVDATGKRLALRELNASEAAEGAEWDLTEVPPGDWRLRVRAAWGGRILQLPDRLLSRVERFAGRVELLEQGRAAVRERLDDTARATLGEYIGAIRSMLDGATPETDVPVARWLERAELMCAEPAGAMDWVSDSAGKEDVWMTLAAGRKKVPVRLRAPAEAEGPLPVLFLFHGAGGSENMFFETYGAGGAVSAGLQRGWLVVAPRQSVFGLPLDGAEMLAVLEQHFAIDRQRVFAIGHSMGAGQVMRQVALNPELFRAAVAVGGGNRAATPEKLSGIPWLVAAGAQDFGRSGAAALARSLKSAGAEVEHHELPDVEHMVIVQAALPLIFEFLDRNSDSR